MLSSAAIILGIIFAPALWQYAPALIDLIFKRKSQRNKELKEDGLAFRTFLLEDNKKLQDQMVVLIASNAALSKQLTEVKSELDATLRILEAKDQVIKELSVEIEKLRVEVKLLSELLKK